MGQWPDTQDQQQSSKQSYALSGRIMLTSIITLFVIVFFLVLLHLYARWYLTRLHHHNNDNNTTRPNPRNRSTRFVYYVNNNNNNRALGLGSSGLDVSVLKSLPLFVYSSETGANTPECAVCLSEFEDGETGRVLPNCKHGFHTGCIDMWFSSHSTCPLCRSPVEPVQTEVTESVSVPEPGSSISLIETTSSEAGRKRNIDVRIDVPVNESVESEFRMTSPSQGVRSPGSRLLSLKRIMNMSRVAPSAGVGPSCDSVATESDVESARHEVEQESSRSGGLG